MKFSFQKNLIPTFNGAFCRLCCLQKDELSRFFPPNGTPNQLLIFKIEYCTGICVSYATDRNASICAKCIERTEKLFRFKQLCVANERWLKMENGSASVVPACTLTEDRMISAASCESLLTIGTEQLEEDFPCSAEADRDLSSIPATQELNEKDRTDESNQVTSSDGRGRPHIKIKIRLAPDTVSSLQDNTAEDSKCLRNSSTAFSLIPGTKSRSGRLYLVYKGYHYSDYQSKKNVYRCTQRNPVYCRAKVLLRNDRVYEINDNSHDHPMPRKSWRRRTITFKE
ncbi:hypothetical protein pipiens_009895 [Culex pipiens pipiens]|uniref:ZAD domain-containing protein n=1 Tax=Culex pipiens pipiens TaxID=38569 RepID=A0ABD1DCC2_CULPP